MPPVVIGAAVAAGGALASSAISSKANKKNRQAALTAQQQQINAANANRDYQYNLNAPSITSGTAADQRISALLNLGGDTAAAQAGFNAYQQSTGYQSRLTEGLESVNNSRFAGGAGQSGATLRALQRTGQDYASREFGNYLGQLGGVSAAGANARGLVAGVGANATNQFINASQNGAQQVINGNNQQAANTNNLISNLVNAGLYAYGSSYKGAGW